LKIVPADGFTEAEHQKLYKLHTARDIEIDACREELLQIGFKRLMKVYHHLWD
jgi:hypothetical protein